MSHLGVMVFFSFFHQLFVSLFSAWDWDTPKSMCVWHNWGWYLYVKPSQKKRVQYEKKITLRKLSSIKLSSLFWLLWIFQESTAPLGVSRRPWKLRGLPFGQFLGCTHFIITSAAIPTKRAPETNMHTNNDGMEKDSPSSYGEFWCSNLFLWRLYETLHQA